MLSPSPVIRVAVAVSTVKVPPSTTTTTATATAITATTVSGTVEPAIPVPTVAASAGRRRAVNPRTPALEASAAVVRLFVLVDDCRLLVPGAAPAPAATAAPRVAPCFLPWRRGGHRPPRLGRMAAAVRRLGSGAVLFAPAAGHPVPVGMLVVPFAAAAAAGRIFAVAAAAAAAAAPAAALGGGLPPLLLVLGFFLAGFLGRLALVLAVALVPLAVPPASGIRLVVAGVVVGRFSSPAAAVLPALLALLVALLLGLLLLLPSLQRLSVLLRRVTCAVLFLLAGPAPVLSQVVVALVAAMLGDAGRGKLSAVLNNYPLHGDRGILPVGLHLAHLYQRLRAGLELSEHYVLAVQVACWGKGDEELAAVAVLAGIRHRQQVLLAVLELEAVGLVLKLSAVDALAARAVPPLEVTPLAHEA